MKKMMTAAVVALLLASCGSNSTTRLTGVFAPDSMAAEAEVIVGDQIDTTVAVVDGQFTLDVPADAKALAYAMADGKQIMFVSDGSAIKLDFENNKAVSANKRGVNARLENYLAWNESFMKDFQAKMEAASKEEQEDILDKAEDEYNDYLVKTVKENSDNVVSLLAVTSLELDDDDEMLALLNGLDESLKQDPRIQSMISAYDAAAKTAEGKMFTDFEVDGVKFSDFIGKGKYVLVDFWASWCGPCRREMPNLRAVYDEFHGEKFDMLSVAVWDKPEDTVVAAAEEKITWNQIVNAQRIPTEIYGIQGIPHIILFGPDGTILKRNLRGEKIREAVADALDD